MHSRESWFNHLDYYYNDAPLDLRQCCDDTHTETAGRNKHQSLKDIPGLDGMTPRVAQTTGYHWTHKTNNKMKLDKRLPCRNVTIDVNRCIVAVGG
ncbi:hypothetical protein EVAR_55010_1 [Eumeta japonica]|uniref:Uncharacterized protein n=1 Tax=Eumeta variegata TaxID=151549 RepID=A0A4C1YE27_EUMVA|nr:hypothetical protein EVAR_55010_1 [Eumeta japonica]